jgi:replicative DNA helicase
MLNWMDKWAFDDNLAGAMFSTEMQMEEIMLRSISLRSGVKERDLKLNTNWQKQPAQHARVRKACEEMDATNNAFHLYLPDFSISKIRGHAIRLKLRHDIKYIIFDYISEPEDESNRRREEWQNLSGFALRLKGLARQLNIPIIVTAQTVLITKNDKMSLQDVAMAKYMSFHADNVIGVINKHAASLTAEQSQGKTDMGNQKCYILKARAGGETRECEGDNMAFINLQFDREILRIREKIQPK